MLYRRPNVSGQGSLKNTLWWWWWAGHGGSFSGLGDGEAGRSSETAELSRARRQWSWKVLEAAELAKAQMLRRWFELRDGVAGPGLAEDGADQSKDDEIWRRRCWPGFGLVRAVKVSETSELTPARPSAVKLLHRLCYAAWTMVTVSFLCTTLIIGRFRYQKMETLLTSYFQYPGTAYGWQILLQPFYNISLSLFKEISHPSGLDSSCKQRFILHFCTPIFNDLYPPTIFEFYKVRNMCEEPAHYLSSATWWIKMFLLFGINSGVK